MNSSPVISKHGGDPNHSKMETSSPETIIALFEGRGSYKGEIGVAEINFKFSTVNLAQFSDNTTYTKLLTKIHLSEPQEVILPFGMYEKNTVNALSKLLADTFPTLVIIKLERKYYNEKKGVELLKNLTKSSFNSYAVELLSQNNSLASFAALVKHLEFTKNIIYKANSLNIVFENGDKFANIDHNTSKHLELVYNARNLNSSQNLLGVMNYTKTKIGLNALRSNILQPLYDPEKIQLRLNAVESLIEDQNYLVSLQNVIDKFRDLEEIITLISNLNAKRNCFNRDSGSIKSVETKIHKLFIIKHILSSIDSLRDLIGVSDSDLIRSYHTKLKAEERFSQIKADIDKVLMDETLYQKNLSLRMQKCFALKANLNGLLDISRRTYLKTTDDMRDYVNDLARQTELPLKVAHNLTRGYFIQLNLRSKNAQALSLVNNPFLVGRAKQGGNAVQKSAPAPALAQERESNVSIVTKASRASTSSLMSSFTYNNKYNLPKEFIKVSKLNSSFQFTTQFLIKLNDRISECTEDIYIMCNSIINELYNSLYGKFDCFYDLFECVAMLDMIVSLAKYSLLSDSSTRPVFNDFELHVLDASHPILNKIANKAANRADPAPASSAQKGVSSAGKTAATTYIQYGLKSVKNQVQVSAIRPFVILTGSNMSGKSTYLKQIGLLQIMAQTGSFVPASDMANFVLAKQIFSRLGTESDVNLSASAFQSEMIEINYILGKMDKINSLILIDELCRSTNIYEGLALCMSICEYMLKRIGSNETNAKSRTFVYFTTHLKELANLECLYPKVTNCHMESEHHVRLRHTYKLAQGVCRVDNYGINLAMVSSMTSDIIREAQILSNEFKTDLNNIFKLGNADRKRQLTFTYFNLLLEYVLIEEKLDDGKLVRAMDELVSAFEGEYSQLLSPQPPQQAQPQTNPEHQQL